MDRVTGPPDWHALPAPAPLEMPVQSLREAGGPPIRPVAAGGMLWRRILVLGGATLLTAFACHEMALVLDVTRPTGLQLALMLLFVALFAWIALSFISALCGFASLLRGGGQPLGIDPAGGLPALTTRTALLMPVYNEPPPRVMAGLQAMHESLSAIGGIAHFHIFILSDTTDPDAWVAEEAAFLSLRARIGTEGIFYRHRPANIGRKAGNIAEWVRRFGAAYPQMVVLDADSVMDGQSLVRLVAAMERHPGVGLIQTLPIIVNGTSFFARMQQFAGRVYGPMIAAGIAWWHGAEGNYWGHNAIIRTRAFAAHAGLPTLPGRKPFGGDILSHDFVEAALLRRAGWGVHMVPAMRGSYEESPPALMELALRDRRWCQGNLQHAGVLSARGLHPISRLHLFMGIGSYITAPLWLLFLVVGVFSALEARFIRPAYFPSGPTLFPDWPVVDPVRAMWLFIGTMALLLLPKVLSWALLLRKTTERQGIGGATRSFLSMLLETVVAGLLAPVTMLTQSRDVVSIMLGRDAGWAAQRRDAGALQLAEVARLYAPHTVFGVVFAIASWLVSPYLALWMLPVTLGLALAVPLAAWTARPSGRLRRWGLLSIPEEAAPPVVLARANALRRELEHEAGPSEAVHRLAADPSLLRAHLAMLPPPRRARLDPVDATRLIAQVKVTEARDLAEGLASMTRAEKAALLGDADGVRRLIGLTRQVERVTQIQPDVQQIAFPAIHCT